MKFKAKKIRQTSRVRNVLWRKMVDCFGVKGSIVVSGLIILAGVFFVWGHTLGFDKISHTSREIFSFGGLKKDSFGHTNIVFLGVAGDAEEGGNLSDSIMLVSINPSGPSASFLSLPRDLFIASEIGDRKINEIYANARYKHGDDKGLDVIKDALSKFTGVNVHYGVAVDFSVFEDFVDTLGGVDIFVPEEINDPFYPDEQYGYQTFVVRKGLQHLDGEMALRYARSRKTTSDYDRAKRQQDLILAIKKKATDHQLFTDFDKLKTFYRIFEKDVNTDLGISDLISLAKLAVGLDYRNSVTAVLNDDPTRKDGFLYTPAREFYGGQFVLLPEDLGDTRIFMRLILDQPEILLEKAQVSILNGTKTSGLAGEAASRLRRFGFHVIETGNYDTQMPIFRSFVHNISVGKTDKTSAILAEILDAELLPPAVDSAAINKPEDGLIDVQVVLGTN